jgi:5'-3' exonuclease
MVLPRTLSYLLPVQIKNLMNSDNLIKKLSPYNFEQDMLYKTKLWQTIPDIEMLPIDHVQDIVSKVSVSENDINRNKTRKVYESNM